MVIYARQPAKCCLFLQIYLKTPAFATWLHPLSFTFVIHNPIYDMKRNHIHLLMMILLCCTVCTGCSSESGSGAHDKHSEEAHADNHDSGEIFIDEKKAAAAGILADTVSIGTFRNVIRVGGRILASPADENTVSATIAGIVSLNRNFTQGSPVSAGSPLFSISTSGLEGGDIVARASIALRAAREEYDRAKALAADHLITQQELLAAETAFGNARLAFEAVGNSNGGSVSVSSPKGGYVMECLVRDGDFVNVGQPLMTITRVRRLNLQADVPERDFAILGSISSARFRLSCSDSVRSLDELDGRILSYGRSTAPGTSFIPLVFEFNNAPGIVPGSYAEVFLLGNERHDVISVPLSAIIEEQGVYSVYIVEHGHHYEKRNVTTGSSDGRRVEIKAGLTPGETYVARGAVKVKLAASAAITPTHTHNH